MKECKFAVSAAPHIVAIDNSRNVMADILIALAPAVIGAGFFFGLRAFVVMFTSVISCVLFEFGYQVIARGIDIKNRKQMTFRNAVSESRKRTDIGDLSAVVTGILLGMNMPVIVPLWMVVVGSVFAVVLVKQLFGGLGNNLVNPALAAKAFMMVCWAGTMSMFTGPVINFGRYILPADAAVTETPLAIIKSGAVKALPTIYDVFIGRVGGAIGETSAFLLIIGGIYLLLRGVIDWKIPFGYIGTFAALMFLFGQSKYNLNFTAYNVCIGGVILGAFFMATDYVTTPVTGKGRAIFGVGCGIITFMIRRFGAHTDGVTYAILIMNIATPLIDKYVHRRRFGMIKRKKAVGKSANGAVIEEGDDA